MKWVKDYFLFKESKSGGISSKKIVTDICVAMILLNNEFLDNILDKGLKSRYTENTNIFLTDLKNLLLAKNRFNLGKFDDDDMCIIDEDTYKINELFNTLEFDIEKDWKVLVNARIIARSIIDKLLPEKLDSNIIKNVYWNLNKNDDYQEDIILELNDGRQFSFYIDKALSKSKTSSFNKFADEIIGGDIDLLYKEQYLDKWDKLTQEWVKLIYENANKSIQKHIEKFIDLNRIDTISYFEYYDIRHGDPRFKHLGEYMKEFNRNILKLSDLMSEIWKNKEECFIDIERIQKEWFETKVVILNSKILENILTSSLKNNFGEHIEKMEDGLKKATGTIKMKFFKVLVEKMGCLERDVYYVDTNEFNLLPSRDFFRKNYDDLDIYFDYHVKLVVVEEDEESNDFTIKLKLNLDGENIINMNITVKFSGGEMSGKLSAKHKFDISPDFNYKISVKNDENI